VAEIDVTINGRSYPITCEDGQEGHITGLAQFIERKVADLVATVGQVGDARLLVMASLMIADELAEAYAALDEAADLGEGARSQTQGAETRTAMALTALAERIEGIAAKLEAA
jgi:cell division protein ZapA